MKASIRLPRRLMLRLGTKINRPGAERRAVISQHHLVYDPVLRCRIYPVQRLQDLSRRLLVRLCAKQATMPLMNPVGLTKACKIDLRVQWRIMHNLHVRLWLVISLIFHSAPFRVPTHLTVVQARLSLPSLKSYTATLGAHLRLRRRRAIWAPSPA